MSMRILLEINTDYLHKILCDPDGFVQDIRDLGTSGNPVVAPEFERMWGVKRVCARHHSDKCQVTINDEAITLSVIVWLWRTMP